MPAISITRGSIGRKDTVSFTQSPGFEPGRAEPIRSLGSDCHRTDQGVSDASPDSAVSTWCGTGVPVGSGRMASKSRCTPSFHRDVCERYRDSGRVLGAKGTDASRDPTEGPCPRISVSYPFHGSFRTPSRNTPPRPSSSPGGIARSSAVRGPRSNFGWMLTWMPGIRRGAETCGRGHFTCDETPCWLHAPRNRTRGRPRPCR